MINIKYMLVVFLPIVQVMLMKKFITEIQGKEAMSADGKKLGTIDNIVVDTTTGELQHLLVIPDPNIDPRAYRRDYQERLVLPFKKIKAVKDVVVIGPL